jgi:hypothetical protein
MPLGMVDTPRAGASPCLNGLPFNHVLIVAAFWEFDRLRCTLQEPVPENIRTPSHGSERMRAGCESPKVMRNTGWALRPVLRG